MKEDFIAYLWKNKLLTPSQMHILSGEKLELIDPGIENHDAGPDFFASRVRIDNTLWVGNVEIHVRSSDWQRHGHQNDPAYDNIILHLVYENDSPATTSTGKIVPVMEVKKMIDDNLLENYQALVANRHWVACEKNINDVDKFFVGNWLNRLLVERLERKAEEVLHYYNFFSNNWDHTFYHLLAHNFGFKVNASPFGLLAQRTPFTLLAKNSNNFTVVEALLFGQAGLLHQNYRDLYPRLLFKEYLHQKKKHGLSPVDRKLWKFARLRPVNFPTLRIAQFAMLINKHERLFRKIMYAQSFSEIQKLLQVQASPYWDNHYSFDKPSARTPKKLGTDSINNLIINTIAPIQFVYGDISQNSSLKESAIALFQSCAPESNSIINKWEKLGIKPENAADSQALLELKKYYCLPKKCLRCAIGHMVLRKK